MEGKFNYLRIDIVRNEKEGIYRILNESRDTTIESIPESEVFYFFKCYIHIDGEKFSKKIEELVSLENQVEELRLQDKLGKRNFHENIKKLYEPVANTIEDISRNVAKTMTEASFEFNKALEILNNKLSGNMIDRGIIASYLLSPLSKIINAEHTIQFIWVKVLHSNRLDNLLINKTIPVTLYNNLLTFRDTFEKLELQVDLLKVITNKNYISVLADLSGKKSLYDFA